MGGCCARQQDMNFDKLNSFQYSVDDLIRINPELKPELTYENATINLNEEDIQLSKIINNLKNIYKEKVNTITLIELFNLAIYNKESFKNNDYIIFDMRRSSEQKEEFLKRIKHINYTYEQIKNIKNTNKFTKLKSFINNKKIIIIIAEFYLNPKNNEEKYRKVDEYPGILCNFLYNINNSISFKILNCCLSKNEKNTYTNTFEEYLSVFHSDEFIPYILFSYQHVTNLIREGFFFISFSSQKIFSFENYVKYLNNKEKNNENDISLNNKLFFDMNITCIININNEIKNLEIKEFITNDKKSIFKEINISKYNLINNKNKLIEIKEWLKQEVIKGNSCYFNVINEENNDNKTKNQDWIYIIIILISLVAEVDYNSVINYFNEKIIYIDNINDILDNINKEEISNILNSLNP